MVTITCIYMALRPIEFALAKNEETDSVPAKENDNRLSL
jgi:hypothetical protein